MGLLIPSFSAEKEGSLARNPYFFTSLYPSLRQRWMSNSVQMYT